jgi:peptidase C54-like protein
MRVMWVMWNGNSSRCLPMTPGHHTRSTTLLDTVLWPAGNTPANGSVLRQQHGAYGQSLCRFCWLSTDPEGRALVNSQDGPIRVYSTGDLPDVYEDSFMATAMPDGENFHPTLILVGTRLGIDKVNKVYWESLTSSLQMPQSVGIAG